MKVMSSYPIILKALLTAVLTAVLLAAGCGAEEKPATPVETLKAYTIAVKKKDVTTMKLLLSAASLKLHQQEAKAQNVTLDDIVLRDTLFPPDQRIFDYRNQKIEGDRASVEVKNNFGGWDVIQLVREEGIWKIDKKATGEQMIQEVETSTDSLDEQIRKEMEEAEKGTEQPGIGPDGSPSPSPGSTIPPPAVPSPDATPADIVPAPVP